MVDLKAASAVPLLPEAQLLALLPVASQGRFFLRMAEALSYLMKLICCHSWILLAV